MRYTTILLILLMAFTFGCAKMVIEGRQIDESKVKDLMASSNTAAKVTQVFGKPDKVEKMASGEEQYSYRYYYMNPHWWTTNDVEEQNLKVMVKDQAVQGYSYRKSSTEKLTKE
jgi:hypothetical protein